MLRGVCTRSRSSSRAAVSTKLPELPSVWPPRRRPDTREMRWILSSARLSSSGASSAMGYGIALTCALAAYVVLGGATAPLGPLPVALGVVWALLLVKRLRAKLRLTGDAKFAPRLRARRAPRRRPRRRAAPLRRDALGSLLAGDVRARRAGRVVRASGARASPWSRGSSLSTRRSVTRRSARRAGRPWPRRPASRSRSRSSTCSSYAPRWRASASRPAACRARARAPPRRRAQLPAARRRRGRRRRRRTPRSASRARASRRSTSRCTMHSSSFAAALDLHTAVLLWRTDSGTHLRISELSTGVRRDPRRALLDRRRRPRRGHRQEGGGAPREPAPLVQGAVLRGRRARCARSRPSRSSTTASCAASSRSIASRTARSRRTSTSSSPRPRATASARSRTSACSCSSSARRSSRGSSIAPRRRSAPRCRRRTSSRRASARRARSRASSSPPSPSGTRPTKMHEVCAARSEGGEIEDLVGQRFKQNTGLVSMVVTNRFPLPYKGEFDPAHQVVLSKRLPWPNIPSLLVLAAAPPRAPARHAHPRREAPPRLRRHRAPDARGPREPPRGQPLQRAHGPQARDHGDDRRPHRAASTSARCSTRPPQKVAAATRFGRKLSVLITDIDFFKKVNDTYGHDVGDVVIKGLARHPQAAEAHHRRRRALRRRGVRGPLRADRRGRRGAPRRAHPRGAREDGLPHADRAALRHVLGRHRDLPGGRRRPGTSSSRRPTRRSTARSARAGIASRPGQPASISRIKAG